MMIDKVCPKCKSWSYDRIDHEDYTEGEFDEILVHWEVRKCGYCGYAYEIRDVYELHSRKVRVVEE